VAVSRDGAVVAFAFREGQIAVHRVADQALLLELANAARPPPREPHLVTVRPYEDPSFLVDVALSPDGSRVAAAAGPSRVAIWRVSDGALLTEVLNPSSAGLQFAPDGSDRFLIGTQLRAQPDGNLVHDFGATFGGFADGGAEVLTYDYEGSAVRAYRADASGTLLRTVPIRYAGDQLSVAGFSPGGRYLAGLEAPTEDTYQVTVFATATGERILTVPGGSGATFSSDGSTVLMANFGYRQAKLVNIETGLVQDVSAFPTGVSAIGPAGRPLFRTDSTGVFWIKEPLAAPQYQRFPTLAGQGLSFLALTSSPDGRWLAAAPSPSLAASDPLFLGDVLSEAVILWDVQQRRGQAVLANHVATSLAFSPDSTRLLIAATDASGEASVQEWPLAAAMATWKLTGAGGGSYSPALDGRRVAVSLWDGASVVTVGDQQVMSNIAVGHRSPGIAFSPRDGGLTVATSGPALWRVSDRKRLWPAEPPPIPPLPDEVFFDRWVTFSPDGSTLLVSEFATHNPPPFYGTTYPLVISRSTTQLYRASDGVLLRDFEDGLSRRPAFSPDGAWIIGGETLYSVESGGFTHLDSRPGVAQHTRLLSTFTSDGTIAVAREDGLIALFCPR
jgi:WD40 repeat protein